ncbi:MAG: DNA cytosine methyltransferase [Kiritimatiellae bacterium]|nr:DNA cytosine methyltransferase [Kiritimatiellia bacterium]
MCSLFDGIGGFPLSFQRAGCEPVWASEIEEFPIAVTKRHFPESSKPVSRLPSGGRVEEAKTARKAWAKANKVKLKFGRSA